MGGIVSVSVSVSGAVVTRFHGKTGMVVPRPLTRIHVNSIPKQNLLYGNVLHPVFQPGARGLFLERIDIE